MKVLFIQGYIPQEMLGIMWLSRAIKDAGHQAQALFIPDTKWLEKLKEYDPDVVCYSVTTGVHTHAVEVNRKVKLTLPNVFSVFGGPHPTFTPQMVEEVGIDAVCRGEGELAMVELLDKLERGEDFYSTENFWFKHSETGEIIKNPQRPIVDDLDALGFPDREIVYESAPLYRDTDRKVFVSQRGCPMPCSFCFHHAWKKKVYNVKNSKYVRKRSVSHLLDELKQVKAKYNLKFVHFVDDIFNLRNDWLDEFCERYPKEVGLPFDVILMANMTTEHHIAQLKQAGCVYARIAIEAASDHVRNAVFKKHTTRKQLTDAAGWIKKHGIRLGTLNMLGGPGGTIEDELDTVRLNIECKVDHPLVSLMQPYPEFDIMDMTKQMGYAVSAYDEFPDKFNRTSTIQYDNKVEIENLQKLFPIVIRFPWLMPVVPRLIKIKWLAKPYLVAYMLWSEYLVAEQAKLYAQATGLRGLRYRAPVDFVIRLSTKGVMRVVDSVMKMFFKRFMAPKRHEVAVALQMGDERVIAHMD